MVNSPELVLAIQKTQQGSLLYPFVIALINRKFNVRKHDVDVFTLEQ